jgi:REP element-mobilizing transposase RayT
MPRKGRLHIPGACYHLIGRGLERRYIFRADEDKSNFLDRFGRSLGRCGAQCLAWAMMSNHYHLLVRIGDKPLSKLMAPLLGGYGGYYNRKYHRSGYVFQNRFKSILCDEDSYLKELIRYIHLNPVRAGLIEGFSELQTYPWTGHSAAIGKYHHEWHSVDEMLSFFGASENAARQAYMEFMAGEQSSTSLSGGGLIRSMGGWETLTRLRKEHVSVVGDERVLGSSHFVENSLKQDELTIDLKSKLEREGWALDKLIAEVCRFCSVSETMLLSRARQKQVSQAKSLVCYWGSEVLSFTSRDIAARLQMSHPAVSYRSKAGQEYCETHQLNIKVLNR